MLNILYDQEFVTVLTIIISITLALMGLCVGSFLNVVIFRFETDETPAKGRSHCMSCGHQLAWYDNIPLLSYLFLKGKCRYCGSHISKQYPIVELLNALSWLAIFIKFGLSMNTIWYCLMLSGLLALSVIDEKHFRIPNSINLYLLFIGIAKFIYTIFTGGDWLELIIGAISVSGFLFFLYFITVGRGLGLGDVKLMFVCGLITGWKIVVSGFLIGCILTVIIHPLRMKLSGKEHKLAFGPYLSTGVAIGLFIGQFLIDWYLTLIGVGL